MKNSDLFIIIKALLWFIPDIQMPTDEEIKKFIIYQKRKEYERND